MMQKRLGWRFNQRHNISDWREHRHDGLRYARKILAIEPQSLIKYHPLWEGNGAVAFDNSSRGNNGTYNGVTLNQLGSGDGRAAPLFPGVAPNLVDIYSAAFNADYDQAELSVSILLRVFNAGVWTDGTIRKVFRLFVDANNTLKAERDPINGTIAWKFEHGGVNKFVNWATGSPLGWFHMGCTISESNDRIRIFGSGAQVGADINGLGVWAGPLGINSTLLGGLSLPAGTQPWHGYMQHFAVWETELSQGHMRELGTL